MGCGVCLERVERPRLVRTQCCLPGRLAAKPWWVRVSNTARVQHIRNSAGTALCWRRVCGRGLFLGAAHLLARDVGVQPRGQAAAAFRAAAPPPSVLRCHRRLSRQDGPRAGRARAAACAAGTLHMHCIHTACTPHMLLGGPSPARAHSARSCRAHCTCTPCAAGDSICTCMCTARHADRAAFAPHIMCTALHAH